MRLPAVDEAEAAQVLARPPALARVAEVGAAAVRMAIRR